MIPLVKSYRRAGRLVPSTARGVRARCVILRRGEVMPWHSTRDREELLIAWRGTMHVEVHRSRPLQRVVRAGQCLFLPSRTLHRVVNRSTAEAAYLYITAPTKYNADCGMRNADCSIRNRQSEIRNQPVG